MRDTHTRTVSLPLGFKATFSWTRVAGMAVQWEPNAPSIRSPRHKRKFLAAYRAARRDFMQDVATSIGQVVAVIDAGDAAASGASIEAIRPAARH